MTASKMLARLGLDPAAAAALGRDVAAASVDVAQLMAREVAARGAADGEGEV